MVVRKVTAVVLLLALPWFAASLGTAEQNLLTGPHLGAEAAVICGNDGGCGAILGVVAVFTCAAFTGPAAIGCGLLAVA